jgi:hypothetical protein
MRPFQTFRRVATSHVWSYAAPRFDRIASLLGKASYLGLSLLRGSLCTPRCAMHASSRRRSEDALHTRYGGLQSHNNAVYEVRWT